MNERAIWYLSDLNYWVIGLIKFTGSDRASFFTKDEFGGLTDKRNVWMLHTEIGWIRAEPNEINVTSIISSKLILEK